MKILMCVGLAVLCSFAGASAGRAEGSYHLLNEITVAGGNKEACLSLDDAGRRLYISQREKISVFDLDKGASAGEMTNVTGVRAITFAPQYHSGFAVDDRHDMISWIDFHRQKIAPLKTGKDPVAVVCDPVHGGLFVFNHGDRSMGSYEADDGDFVAAVQLPGAPVAGAINPKEKRVYCSFENTNMVASIHANTRKMSTWPTAPGNSPGSMAVDVANNRLFVSCDKMLVVMNGTNGAIVTTLPTDFVSTTLAFDPGTQLLFGFDGEGSVSIFHEEAPDKVVLKQTLKPEHGSGAMALDTKTHRLYLTEAGDGPGSGGQNNSGGLKILVYSGDNEPPK